MRAELFSCQGLKSHRVFSVLYPFPREDTLTWDRYEAVVTEHNISVPTIICSTADIREGAEGKRFFKGC